MRKVSFSPTFFKDILFNEFMHYKYLFVNKVLLLGGICLECISFFLSLFLGSQIVDDVNNALKIINALLIIGIFIIRHRFKINVLNISRDISNIDYDSLSISTVKEIEVLPRNFILYEDMPLSLLKKIYKEGAYIIVKTSTKEFTFYAENDDVYLIDEVDEKMSEVKMLKLSREII